MSRLLLGVVIVAVLAGGGGFAAGRATAADSGEADPGKEDCAAVRTVEKEAELEVDRLGLDEELDSDDFVLSVRTHAYVITQNPNCFPSQDRAEAQATLDKWKRYEG
ncbi:hypothetical protein [Streptomyces sp. NBC_00887]|uniref:hypothetical protein n=1 Tax=Streptomyces sp. NBC_00887 TaxID=2975859 RepID=UPI003867BFA8|nr:hypothetical protein OG844_29640 [Streptomyces sp. NBC_00887]